MCLAGETGKKKKQPQKTAQARVFVRMFSHDVFANSCPPFVTSSSDPQPVHDMCGLPSCQGIHRGQDGACSGQDLRLLRTRCASDEYFKKCSLKRKTLAVIYEAVPFFTGNGILFKLKSQFLFLFFCECVSSLSLRDG